MGPAQAADQALLLARVVASVVALGCCGVGEAALFAVGRSHAMFAELGTPALPTLTSAMVGAAPVLVFGVPALLGVTLFFIWSRGKTAAWMAGAGLFLMMLCAPLASWGVLLPLMKILEEMGTV